MPGFDDIIGQKAVIEHIKTAISTGNPSHAYIFCGDEGTGKKTIAGLFAAGLLCAAAPEADKPCGSCIPCMQSMSGSHPDIIRVTHEKKNITVGDIRTQVISDIQVRPYSGDFKIYIIDDADKMNEEAQNAILKTLEEPPSYAVILLLAKTTGTFLQTILSRCVLLRFVPLDNSVIKDYLIKTLHIPDYLAKLCAAFSNGSIGRALKFASSESFNECRERLINLVRNISNMTQAEIAQELSALNPSKNPDSEVSFDDFLNLLGIWYHDVLIYKATANPNSIVFLSELDLIRAQARENDYERISDLINAIDKTRSRLAANVYFDVAVELLLIKMKGK